MHIPTRVAGIFQEPYVRGVSWPGGSSNRLIELTGGGWWTMHESV